MKASRTDFKIYDLDLKRSNWRDRLLDLMKNDRILKDFLISQWILQNGNIDIAGMNNIKSIFLYNLLKPLRTIPNKSF